MPLSEADTRAKLIDPVLHSRGWTEDLIRREETGQGIDIIDGRPKRRQRGRTDYLLRIRVNISTQPVAVALIEAKRSDEPPDKGLEQAKEYACLNHVPFVYSSNGHLFTEYDYFTGKTIAHTSLEEFPTPAELRTRYEQWTGFSNATRLLGKGFVTRPVPTRETREPEGEGKEKVIRVEGFDIHINSAGTYIVTQKEDKLSMVTVEEYREPLATHLVDEARTLDDFRSIWTEPTERRNLINKLPDDGRGVRLLREIMQWQEYDLYDVLTQIAYGMAPKTGKERVEALRYKHADWFQSLPPQTGNTLIALARQFAKGGTEELENPYVFSAPEVRKAGGLEALKVLGEPRDIISETKKRLFAV